MTPTEIVASHGVLWSIDGNIQCHCKALMRHDEHPAHIVGELGLVQFWSVAYGAGDQDELSWENWDEARDRAADAISAGGDPEDVKIITSWFTGWQDAETPAHA